MARLESQKKMGYYPTPLEVVAHLKHIINFQDGSRIIDTCCGPGEALKALADGEPVQTYGIELDIDRAAEAKDNLDNVLQCDALNEVRITNESFGCLFLNPPYDWDTHNNEGKSTRLEKKFLQYHMRYLDRNGLIVYLVPVYSLKYVYKMFWKFKNLQVLSFPEELFAKYKQVVLIGQATLVKNMATIEKNKQYLKEIMSYEDFEEKPFEYLDTTDKLVTQDPIYTVPVAKPLNRFDSTRINPDEAIHLVTGSTLHTQFKCETDIQTMDEIRPLAPLKNGHLALLLASGMMDGRMKAKGRDLVVKGKVNKTMETVDKPTDKEDLCCEVSTTKYSVSVKAIDLDSGKLLNIQ